MTELETFRRQKDRYFKTGPDSPIPREQRDGFAGLVYYPERADMRLIVQPEELAEDEEDDAILIKEAAIQIQSTVREQVQFRKYYQ